LNFAAVTPDIRPRRFADLPNGAEIKNFDEATFG
jgi:hypothetical protein